MKVLLVEDDVTTAEIIKKDLTSHGYIIDVSHTGADGSFMARSFEYDVIVLDYSLPQKNGLDVCKEIRAARKPTPIVFLSATDDISLKVSALDLGANDYITKPFSLEELRARLRTVTRGETYTNQHIFIVRDIELDTQKNLVKRGKENVQLTRKEFSLLEYLMRNPGKLLSRSMLMEHVWTADSDPFSNTIEAHMRNLRKKINSKGKLDLIKTVPGRGYVIDDIGNLSKFD